MRNKAAQWRKWAILKYLYEIVNTHGPVSTSGIAYHLVERKWLVFRSDNDRRQQVLYTLQTLEKDGLVECTYETVEYGWKLTSVGVDFVHSRLVVNEHMTPEKSQEEFARYG